ncbi:MULTISPECIES: hypothetical protein [unclassified Streptomyces]|uniref:hypothetical protein n=1 Tax=unclassified Streptomyces TaxID=2593676 RepID=UPI001C30582D|nr:hypothetical protein [Streptomyces sp. GbtcB7]
MKIAQGIDWGTVPAWFSALLSGGSVLLALYIIWRDRKKAEREDATKVICWSEDSHDGRTTYVHNASSRAVHAAAAVIWLKGEKGARGGDVFQDAYLGHIIRPGEEASVETPRWLDDGAGPKCVPWAVQFQDSDGQRWVRDLTSAGRLHKGNTAPRLRWRVTTQYWRNVRHKRRKIRQITQRGG